MEARSRIDVGKAMLAKIVVGIVSTVAAAVILSFVLRGNSEVDKRKEATVRAWNAYLQAMDTLDKSAQKFGLDLAQEIDRLGPKNDFRIQIKKAGETTGREIDLTIQALEDIGSGGDFDPRVKTIIDLTIRQAKDLIAVTQSHFEELAKLVSMNLTDEQGAKRVDILNAETVKKKSEVKNRYKDRYDRLHQALCKEYDIDLPRRLGNASK